jgi:hypothetical protein
MKVAKKLSQMIWMMLLLVQVLEVTSCVKEAMNSFSEIACPTSIHCEDPMHGKILDAYHYHL